MEKQNTYILNLEGKDIYTTNKKDSELGYIIKSKDNKRYKGSLDYSLEAIKIDEIGTELFPVKKKKDKPIFHLKDDKQYTDYVVNLNFNYSVQEDDIDKEGNVKLDKDGKPKKKVIVKTDQLRNWCYDNPFKITINGTTREYVKFKRSCGSSRQGKCLFIVKDLYIRILEWSLMGLNIKENDKVDLPALESYLALTSSSIIDTIHIEPKNILIVEDYKSIFTDKVVETKLVDGKLKTAINDKANIENKIWDGQSLLDSSCYGVCTDKKIHWVNGKYADKCMLLLRNRFFKSACFSANVQKFFEDNNITDISQLNGFTLAENIEDIKIITTPSSIKYTKFGTLEKWLEQLEPTFGIVKYDKPTKHFDGDLVSTSYQLLQTLNFDDTNKLEDFLKPTIDYINLLKSDIRVFRNHLHIQIRKNLEIGETTSTDELILNMLKVSDKFQETELFDKFKDDTIDSFKKKMFRGHVLVEGNFSTLLSSPIEMLKYSIKKWDEKSILGVGNIMSKNFNYGIKLLGARSPHVCQGNLLLANNVYNKDIDKYINLSKQVVVINCVKENIMQRLSSCDMDSDQMLLTNNQYCLAAMEKYYDKFLVPTTALEGEGADYYYTSKCMADMDSKSAKSQQLIGEIVNLSAFLNSILWNKLNNGESIKDVQELYNAICQLDIMSTLAIDGAKKTFKGLDLKKELTKARIKWLDKEIVDQELNTAPQDIIEMWYEMEGLREDEQDISDYRKKLVNYRKKAVRPLFFKYLPKKDKDKETNVEYVYKKYTCTMDNIIELINSSIERKTREANKHTLQLMQLLNLDKIDQKADYRQEDKIIADVTEMVNKCNAVFANKNKAWKEKLAEQTLLRKELIEKYANKINAKTIQKIILDIGHTDEYSAIERKLVNILYRSNKEAFIGLFTCKYEADKCIDTLIRLDKLNEDKKYNDDNIIELYGIKYLSIKIKRNLQKYNLQTVDISHFILPPMGKKGK